MLGHRGPTGLFIAARCSIGMAQTAANEITLKHMETDNEGHFTIIIPQCCWCDLDRRRLQSQRWTLLIRNSARDQPLLL